MLLDYGILSMLVPLVSCYLCGYVQNEHKCKPKRQRADTTPDGPAAAAAAELPFQRIAKCWNGAALPPCVVEQCKMSMPVSLTLYTCEC
ncbi:hypothetical protein QJQ45_028420 [Haematococcus lacustris]|nr:hypothetical protein QJQ45_028420 [Haematococcus lacustris]